MELQNLVKVKVRTLDPGAEAIEVTVASSDGTIQGGQVFKKVCDKLGLKSTSRSCFALFDTGEQPTRRYRPSEGIPVTRTELCLAKWCFVSGQERDLLHGDPVAAHLVFLQARHDAHSGKFDLSEDEKQKLEECLQPGFVAEDQFILLCQKQPNYHSLHVPQCRLQAPLLQAQGMMLESGTMVTVVVSKFGVKLVAGEKMVTFTWFEVSHWTLNKEETTLTFSWQPDKQGEPSDIPLLGPQVNLLLAGVLQMITILQKVETSGASFHTEMITVREDGSTVWENGLYNPAQARTVHYTV